MGFTKTVIRAGNGILPKRGQNVTVHCTGYGKNRDLSEKFWSTKDPGQEPFAFRVGMGEVIKVSMPHCRRRGEFSSTSTVHERRSFFMLLYRGHVP